METKPHFNLLWETLFWSSGGSLMCQDGLKSLSCSKNLKAILISGSKSHFSTLVGAIVSHHKVMVINTNYNLLWEALCWIVEGWLILEYGLNSHHVTMAPN